MSINNANVVRSKLGGYEIEMIDRKEQIPRKIQLCSKSK